MLQCFISKEGEIMGDFGPMSIIFLLLALTGLYVVYSGKKKMKIKDGKLVEEEDSSSNETQTH